MKLAPAQSPRAAPPQRGEICPTCNGSGDEPFDLHMLHHGPVRVECWDCDGTGIVKVLEDWVTPLLKELGL